MSDRTNKGHKLVFTKQAGAIQFDCRATQVGWEKPTGYVRFPDDAPASLSIYAPTTHGQMATWCARG
jgi:hypothetical protein